LDMEAQAVVEGLQANVEHRQQMRRGAS